jgi:hypothetical protein
LAARRTGRAQRLIHHPAIGSEVTLLRGIRVSPFIADNRDLAALWVYWQAKRGARAMPRRRDIDPTEIPRLLPHLQIVEVIGEAQRFRYRLAGTAICEAFGRDPTGRFVDEIIPAERLAIAHHHYRLVWETHRPIFVRNKYTTTKAVDIVASRLILPLSEDGERVSKLLMAQTFEYGARIIPGGLDATTVVDAYRGQIEILALSDAATENGGKRGSAASAPAFSQAERA